MSLRLTPATVAVDFGFSSTAGGGVGAGSSGGFVSSGSGFGSSGGAGGSAWVGAGGGVGSAAGGGGEPPQAARVNDSDTIEAEVIQRMGGP